jgi:5-methylcytosine-specific restriction protein A
MDHVVPLARGGRSTKGNLVPACKDCNNKKKNLLPMEWEAYIARLRKPLALRLPASRGRPKSCC